MGKDSQERLQRILAKACERHPHNREIITAFGPILLASRRLAPEPPAGQALNLDEKSFQAGIPLMRQNDYSADAPWEALVQDLIPSIVQGMPTLKADMERLPAYLSAHPQVLTEIVCADARMRAELVTHHATEAGIAAAALEFVVRTISGTWLAGQARAWAELLKGFAWEHGYCPICGTAPMLAHIDEGVPRRWLHCACCGHAWEFSRVICPACANTDQKTMTYFFVEDQAEESTFTCDHCRHYLVTVNKVSDLAEFEADVAALSLIHLDVLMQEKGYHPMADTAWNAL
jgi:FdhE protein